jgi:hypothetical protein
MIVKGRAMAQVVNCRPLTAAAPVRARVNAVGFVVEKVALGQVFLHVLPFFPCQYYSTAGSTFPKIKKIVLSLFTPSLIFIRGRTIGP